MSLTCPVLTEASPSRYRYTQTHTSLFMNQINQLCSLTPRTLTLFWPQEPSLNPQAGSTFQKCPHFSSRKSTGTWVLNSKYKDTHTSTNPGWLGPVNKKNTDYTHQRILLQICGTETLKPGRAHKSTLADRQVSPTQTNPHLGDSKHRRLDSSSSNVCISVAASRSAPADCDESTCPLQLLIHFQ